MSITSTSSGCRWATPPFVLGLGLGLGAGCTSTDPAPEGRPGSPGQPGSQEEVGTEPQASEGGEGTASEEGAVRGWTSAYLRFRRTDDAEDVDLVQTTSLDVGNPEEDPVTGHLLLYAAADLDGKDFEDGSDSDFFDLDDTYSSDVSARLYEAYADVHRWEDLRHLRLGRQSLYDTPEQVWFDGAWLETAEIDDGGTRAGAYLGRGVRLFETAVDGDRVGGLYVQTRPWRAGRVRLDYMHLEDETRLLSTKDDLWSVRAWQRLGDERALRLSGGHSRLGSEARDWFLRARWHDPQRALGAQVRFYELLEPQGDLVFELDPFSALLFELRPYRQWHLQASKGFGEHVSLEGGLALREVSEEEDEGEFNRDFDRHHVSLSLIELPGEVEVTFTGAVYDDSGIETETWGVDLARELGESWRGSLGSYYSLYRIDLFQNIERDHVRTWYARARGGWREDLTLDLRLEYEEDDFDDYLVMRGGVRWAF